MTKKNQQSGLTTEELQQLLVATIDLPFIREKRTKTDYMLDVLETVLNFHLQEPVVLSALAYFQKHHNPPPVHQWQPQCIHTHADLQNALNGFADTPEGNKEASQYLWGNRHWTRIGLLRRFMEFLTSINVTDQTSLHAWAKQASFERDFKGKVPGLGIAVYSWMLLRCGVPTIKPDVWVIFFAKRILGDRYIREQKLVDAFHEIAPLIGESLETIDLTIWYFEKLDMATTDSPQLRIAWWHMFQQELKERLRAAPERAEWRVCLDDKEKLRYRPSGLLIMNCDLLSTDKATTPTTIHLHQSSWHKGFELAMRVEHPAVLPTDVYDHLLAQVESQKLDWVTSNELTFVARIDLGVALSFVPTTTLAELREVALVVAQRVLNSLGFFAFNKLN